MKSGRTATAVEHAEIPKDLLRSIPRECELTGLGKFVAVLAILVVAGGIVGSVAIYLSATRAATLRHDMEVSGRDASATLVKRVRTSGDDKKDIFTYEFEVEGKKYQGRTTVGIKRSPSYQVGDAVPIRYQALRPQDNWMQGHPPGNVPLFLIPVLSVSCLAGAWAIVVALRKQRELLSQGHPAIAVVKRVKRIASDKHQTQRAFIEFSVMSGAVREGSVDFQRRAPEPGSTIVILYDPENPSRLTKYPPALVRLHAY